MGNDILGEVRIFAGTCPPQYWAFCDGAMQQISANQPLFSIIGNAFGGTSPQTFALPKLADPAPGLKYIICTAGLYPVR